METTNNKRSLSNITGMWLVLFSFMIVLFVLSANNGFSNVFRTNAPDGQFLYLISKAFGLTALFLLWWQLFSALLATLGIFDKAGMTGLKTGKATHIIIGGLLAVIIISHAALFISAVSLRQDLLALYLLVPDFSGYYHIGVSLGVIALFVILAAIILAATRRYAQRLWMYGHKLVMLGFALAVLHAVLIGSETGSGMVLFLILFFVVSIVGVSIAYAWQMIDKRGQN